MAAVAVRMLEIRAIVAGLVVLVAVSAVKPVVAVQMQAGRLVVVLV